jgi:hypothetical protein
MDIHSVQGPVHSRKDFLVHIAIITIGILIALSLENFVEWKHHRNLLHDARANLATEISANRKTMETYMQDIRKRQEQLSRVVSTMEALEEKKSVPTDLDMTYTFHTFDSAAWNAATASGAVTFMRYDELQHYTDIYNGQNAFQVLQAEASRHTADLASRLQLMDIRQKGAAHEHKTLPAEKLEDVEREAREELLTTRLLQAVGQTTLEAYGKVSPRH